MYQHFCKHKKYHTTLLQYTTNIPWWWHSGLERSTRKRKVGCSNPRRDRSKSEKTGGDSSTA